jgi:hypothetical protein
MGIRNLLTVNRHRKICRRILLEAKVHNGQERKKNNNFMETS